MGPAKEFKDDPITENSEECQRLRQAEARAKRIRFDNQDLIVPYPRYQFNVAGWNNGAYRIQLDQCIY
uniref:Uncharacterized protein n=1 Tax=Magallana gigas TaxID=29159 RepID=K1PQS7_MAGGI